MSRVRNWQPALVAFAEAVRGEPFVWGRTDCGTLVWRALDVIYERHPLPIRPAYESLRDAREAHEETGGTEAVCRAAGFAEVASAFAQSGDVALPSRTDTAGLPSAGVVVGGRVLLTAPETGPALVALPDAFADGGVALRAGGAA